MPVRPDSYDQWFSHWEGSSLPQIKIPQELGKSNWGSSQRSAISGQHGLGIGRVEGWAGARTRKKINFFCARGLRGAGAGFGLWGDFQFPNTETQSWKLGVRSTVTGFTPEDFRTDSGATLEAGSRNNEKKCPCMSKQHGVEYFLES